MTAAPARDVPAADTDDLARRLRLAVLRLGRRMAAHAPPDPGLTPARLVALGVLDLFGPMRIGALAEQLGSTAPTASRLVECLDERGLVARTPDPDDHRATRVHLTPAGRARLDDHRARTTSDLAHAVATLPPARRALLAAALPVLEELAHPDGPGPSPGESVRIGARMSRPG